MTNEKIAIFGCRDGKHIYSEIKRQNSLCYEVVCFVDNDKKYRGITVDDIPVISAVDVARKYISNEISGVIIAVRKGYGRYHIIKQLEAVGVDNLILVRPSVLTFDLPLRTDDFFIAKTTTNPYCTILKLMLQMVATLIAEDAFIFQTYMKEMSFPTWKECCMGYIK